MLVCIVFNIKVKVSLFYFVSFKVCFRLVIYGGMVYIYYFDYQGCDRQYFVELDRS